jgi:hypothetical protein
VSKVRRVSFRHDRGCQRLPIMHSRPKLPDDLVERARKVFSARYEREVDHTEAREMLERLTELFKILGRWERAIEKGSAEM